MTKKEAEHMSEVFKAYSEGKEIQFLHKNIDGETWRDFKPGVEPEFNFQVNHYRIKPKRKLRPYADAKEFIAAQKVHGPYITYINGSEYLFMPDLISNLGFHISKSKFSGQDVYIPYDFMSEHFKWQDDTLCGIIELNYIKL